MVAAEYQLLPQRDDDDAAPRGLYGRILMEEVYGLHGFRTTCILAEDIYPFLQRLLLLLILRPLRADIAPCGELTESRIGQAIIKACLCATHQCATCTFTTWITVCPCCLLAPGSFRTRCTSWL
jgi:hypothetical protein